MQYCFGSIRVNHLRYSVSDRIRYIAIQKTDADVYDFLNNASITDALVFLRKPLVFGIV